MAKKTTKKTARKSTARKAAASKATKAAKATRKSTRKAAKGSRKAAKSTKRTKSTRKAVKRELIDTGTDKRYVRRGVRGQFDESDDVGRSLTIDRRTKAKTKVKSGQGDKGDQ
jgi:hypothetical protein